MTDITHEAQSRSDDGARLTRLDERPLWFGPESRPLFGWLGTPEEERARGAVLLCSPIGTDARAGHRAIRALGGMLRAAGFVTLRFDYDGIGDSAGRWQDPGRVDAWVGSIREAADLLRQTGAPRLSAIGLGIGAALLDEAAPAIDPAELVLWDPVVDGRRFVREQRLLMPPPDRPETVDPDGPVEVPGFAFSPELLDDLGRIDLARSISADGRSGATLLLPADDRPVARTLRRALEDRDDVEIGSARGHAELFQVHPDVSALPLETMRTIVDWLGRAPEHPFVPSDRVGRSSAVYTLDSGTTIRERAVVFGAAGLFAMLTDPIDGAPSRPGSPRLVMVNNGGETHIGPGRLWVDWGRRWATDGVRSARVDMSGFGDSGMHPRQVPFRLYERGWFDDDRDIAETFTRDETGGIVLLGLCSSAYTALESALGPTPPRGIVVINPMLRTSAASDPYADPRRRAWRSDPPFLRPLARRSPKTARRIARIIREFAVGLSPMDVFAKAVRSGVGVYVLYCPPDLWQYGDDVYWHLVGMPRLRRTGRFSFEIDPRVDHALHRREAREAAHDRIRDHLLQTYYRDSDPRRP